MRIIRVSNVYSKKLIFEKVCPFFELNNCDFYLDFLLLLQFESGIGAKFVDFKCILYLDIRDRTGSNFRIIEISSITTFKHLIRHLYGDRKKMFCDILKTLRTNSEIEEIKWHDFIN